MTREEAINSLIRLRQQQKDKSEIHKALGMAIDSLAYQAELPAGLDEAAEKYSHANMYDGWDYERIYNAFKAGAEYGMNQMFTIKYDNEPLDSAARKTFEKWIPMEILEYNGFQMPLYNQGALIMMFEAGAKWQAEQDKEIIEVAEDHAMLAGRIQMKEEMMKEAVEYGISHTRYLCIPRSHQRKLGLNPGDKVKILIVKEDG